MSRDVVLDIVFAKMIASQWVEGVEALTDAWDDVYEANRAVIMKGLMRDYASAVQRNDVGRLVDVRGAIQAVTVGKAMEMFNYASGQREVEVVRDSKGRFSRHLSGAKAYTSPEQRDVGGRKKGQVAVQSSSMQEEIRRNLEGGAFTDPDDVRQKRRELGQSQAGKVRAIATFQDELMSLFGEDSKDVLVVLSNPVQGTGETAQIGVADPVSDAALQLAQSEGAQMTYALGPQASPEARSKSRMLNQLMESGIRPDVAAELVGAENAGGAVANVQNAFAAYGGRKPNTNAEKARRSFATADALGAYFEGSGIPQLQSAGTALRTASKIGGKIDDKTYAMAERANYRYRGMKDNLPREYSAALKTPEHNVMTKVFDDPNLSRERWAAIKESVLFPRANQERSLSMRRDGSGASFSDAHLAELSYLSRNVPERVSPRDFIDLYGRDMAVASLIPEIPSDRRAVELGEKAGFGVPSSGIIIRPDGAVKEMYRGIAEDHYLPFSAKALPELRDGQYVRTRVLGGLTPEDITTTVVSGARKATVVSGSGVFTIELKPNVTLEGRMSSPEVAAMGERYERILDQVAESGIYMVDLPPQRKAELRAEAAERVGTTKGDAFNRRYEALVDAERVKASKLTDEEREAIRAKAEAYFSDPSIGGASPQQRRQIAAEMVEEEIAAAEAEKVRSVSLNAEGYALALETLRLQYPSIIRRVSHESLGDFVSSREMTDVINSDAIALRNRRGASDKGLVRAGGTRAHSPEWAQQRTARVEETLKRERERAGAETTGSAGAPGTPGRAPAFAPAAIKADPQLEADARKLAGSLKINPAVALTAPNKVVDGSKGKVLDYIEDPSKRGMDTTLNKGLGAGRFAASHVAAMNLAGSDEGLGVAMALAFHGDDNSPDAWEDVYVDDDGNNHVNEARVVLDTNVSIGLLTKAEITNAPVDSATLSFYIPPDVLSSVKEQPTTPEDKAKARKALHDTAYDMVTANGKAHIAAKTVLDTSMRIDPVFKEIDQGFAHSDVSDLSVLGLLAAQNVVSSRIEGVSSKTDKDAAFITAIDDTAFDNNGANLEAAKKRAKAAYQGVIGTEYLIKRLGGGEVGPKGTNVVAKSAPLTVDEHLALLLQWSQSNPQPVAKAAPPPSGLRRTLVPSR